MSRFDRKSYIYELVKAHKKMKHSELLIALPSCSEQVLSYHIDELVRCGLLVKNGQVYEMAR